MSETELNLSQHEQAVKLHNKIMASASLAQQSLWEMCKNLKEMHDGKLYKEFGYQNFEDYCKNEIGFSRTNAYRYISIAENVNPENVTPGLQIGMKKLYLLSTISESEQHEITEKVNLEETTVKQLKAEIDKLKSEKKNYEELIEDINADKHEAEAQAEQAENNLKDVEKELKIAERKLKEAKGENTRLERENEELRSRPVDIAVVDNSGEYDRKLQEAMEKAKQEKKEREAELEAKFRAENEAIRKKLSIAFGKSLTWYKRLVRRSQVKVELEIFLVSIGFNLHKFYNKQMRPQRAA